MSSLNAAAVRLLFTFVLLFAQQQATLHALAHDFDRMHASASDVTHDDEAACAKCVALAHLGHANSGAAYAPGVFAYAPPQVPLAVLASATPATPRRYLSRAPPRFS